MAERLADAVSPYLRSHAGNPVDWYPWGDEAFAAARDRDVPVLVSIGYATCHWCHVMARESFSDPDLAAYVNEHFVAIKVDREEHPEVDAAYLAAAGVFTDQLGWPLNVFTTPDGRTFHAGTYSPPVPVPGHASFRQVLEAVVDAWEQRRGELEAVGAQLTQALASASSRSERRAAVTPTGLERVAQELVGYEDREFGGFGGAPKFPVAPVLLLALALARSPAVPAAMGTAIGAVADRALAAMRDRGLRDPVEGGFFRYAVRRDWTEPHYERMLTDNALLLAAYAEAGDGATTAGVVNFLSGVLGRPDGTFASAQDSESDVDGRRTEGGYYRLDAAERARQPRPAVDAKVLTGWNGLAIGALAHAGSLLGEPEWIALAERAADALLAAHRLPSGRLLRASLDGRPSAAVATLEDYGGLADGLLRLAIAAGRPDLAVVGRELVDACLEDDGIRAPGGGDPTLVAMGLPGDADPGEGAYPSGSTMLATAAWRLFLLTGEQRYRAVAESTVAAVGALALARPISFGGMLALALATLEPVRQLVVVSPDPSADLAHAARGMPTAITAVLAEETAAAFAAAGFELFEGRIAQDGRPTAYACRDFVCRMPVTDPVALAAAFT